LAGSRRCWIVSKGASNWQLATAKSWDDPSFSFWDETGQRQAILE
jgi:hypothetical protein